MMYSNVEKIKKAETTALCLTAAAIIIIIAAFISPFVYLSHRYSDFQKTDSIEEYLNDNYIKYNGGKEAGSFFESFAKSGIGNNILFKYRDNDARLTLKSASHTVFVLDVEYEPEAYLSQKEHISNSTDTPDKDNSKSYYGSFLLASVILDDSLYKDNYCCIGFDNERCIIRYMFFYNTERKKALSDGIYSIKSIINSSVMLDWGEIA